MAKKVVQINVTSNWGSTGRICEGIGSLAMSMGWEAYVAYGRDVVQGAVPAIKVGNKVDTYLHLFGARIFDRQGLYSKSATKKLIKQLEEIKPDVIHLHNIHGYFLNYKLLFDYIRTNNIPVVWTLHDCWPFTGHCVYFDNVDCERWKQGCGSCPQINSYPTSICLDRSKANWQEKFQAFANQNITFVPVSSWIGGFLKHSFLKSHPSHVIHNGIDLNAFHPIADAKVTVESRYNFPSRRRIVLGVASRWDGRKGFDDFTKLAETLDQGKFQLVIVGVNDKQLKELPASVVGIKRTDSVNELAKLYSAADVYINPTYSDTYPTTNLEAIACGTPVITYRTGGSPESVTEDTGMVVPRGDIDALAKAIERIEKTDLVVRACSEYALAHFDKNKCFAQYLNIYNKLI